MISFPVCGPVIVTRYKGPTDHRGSRAVASHKRDNETTHRASVSWDPALSAEANHERAARACLAKCDFSEPLHLVARGHDQDAYHWVFVGSWQVPQESDSAVLDAVANLLSGSVWDADTLSAVADLIRQTGRTVDDLA